MKNSSVIGLVLAIILTAIVLIQPATAAGKLVVGMRL